MATDSTSAPIPLSDVLREGGRIAAILLFWGALAAVGRFGIGNVGYGHPGGFFATLGDAVALLCLVTGLVSVLVYAVARGVQLSGR